MHMRAVAFLCMTPVFLLISGCSKSNPASPNTYTLTVTLQPPVAGAAGKTAYLKLVASGGAATSPALYSANVVFPGTGNASVSIGKIASGTYHGWAFIDMNGSGGTAPDAGDYTADNEIPITSNVNDTIPSVGWTGI